jgi:HSP20 family protein
MVGYPTLWRQRTPTFWDDLYAIRNEFDRLFDRGFGGDVVTGWLPVVDIHETADSVIMQAELPGLRSEDVNVSVENGILTVSGEKRKEIEEGSRDSNYHLMERRYGRFERSFRLPQTVQADAVKAEFSNGVLTVTLPKAEEAKARRIEIKVRNGK